MGYLLAGVTALIWGLIFIPVKRAETPGTLGIAVSMPAGVLTLGLIQLGAVLFADVKPVDVTGLLTSRTGWLLLLVGVFQFPVATMFYYESIRCAEVSTTVPLTRIKSVLVALLVVAVGIESITWKIGAACVIGVAGAIVLTHRRNGARQAKDARQMRLGIAFALLASVSWAVGDIFVRIALKDVPALPLTLITLCLGTVATYLVMLVRGQMRSVFRMPAADKWRYIAHGVLSFGVAYPAFFAAIAMLGEHGLMRANIVAATWPLVAFAVGLTLFRERITVAKVVGVILLTASVFLVIIK